MGKGSKGLSIPVPSSNGDGKGKGNKGKGTSWFAGIEDARVTGSGEYIVPGDWELEIRELKKFESQQVDGKKFFCAEFDIIDCNVDLKVIRAQLEDDDGKIPKALKKDWATAQSFKAGGKISWLVDLTQKSAFGNIKGFVLGMAPEYSEDDITAATVDWLTGADNPAAGIRLHADAFHTPIRSRPGAVFTKVNWELSKDGEKMKTTDDDDDEAALKAAKKAAKVAKKAQKKAKKAAASDDIPF